MEKHIPNFLLFAVIITLCGVPLLFGRLFRPSKEMNNKPFDGGESGVSKPWVRFPSQAHLLFVAFGAFIVALLFLFPAAVEFRNQVTSGEAKEAFLAIFVFLSILITAFIYAAAKGDLDWKSHIAEDDKE